MTDKMSVEDWMKEVARLWPFDREHYPALDLNRRPYADAKHVALHIAKDAGRIAGGLESVDHGGSVKYMDVNRATRNQLVNVLRLCDLMGWSPTDLLNDYRREYS